jgi:hypothetical protein
MSQWLSEYGRQDGQQLFHQLLHMDWEKKLFFNPLDLVILNTFLSS